MDQASVSDQTPSPSPGWLPELAVFVAAFLGHLPAMGAWWALDDWGQLARAAGLDTGEIVTGVPARWLSQHLYWDLTWPLFGLHTDPHALVRLILHGIAAVLVVRIARRSRLGTLSSAVAGLVFAASPLAFTPLYWASGIQELLAAVFALGAVNCWLGGATGGRKRLVWASGLVVLSILSKESGLGLPLLFLVFVWLRLGVRLADKAFAWAMIMLLLAVAVAEGVLVSEHFATASGAAYATGGFERVLINLTVCGWWLLSPGPILASHIAPWMSGIGAAFLLVWAGWGVVAWRRWRSPVVGLALLAALLVLGPALPLRKRLVPYLAYLAAAPVGLMLGATIHRLQAWRPAVRRPWPLIGVAAVAALGWSFFSMETRLNNRIELGLVADPIARGTALSWQACRTMREIAQRPSPAADKVPGLTHLTLLQPVVDAATLEQAERLGDRWVQPSNMYQALGGTLGPQLLLGPAVQINWANSLTSASSKAVVLCETGTGFRIWGNTINALFYSALTDIGLGHFQRARRDLARAAALGGERFAFVFDEGQMVVPLPLVLENKAAFVDWTLGLLDNGSASRFEVGGLQEVFFNLLHSATGRSLKDLTAGSRILSQPSPTVPSD